MDTLKARGEQVKWKDLSQHLERKSRLYERNLHIKNLLRMQELLDEESFRKWKKLRFGGQHPPAANDPFDNLNRDHHE
ncbi:MAG: hypothetical protein GWM98_13205 [Nitrospinaceae bacterium]|nr:hypothetical protein [Nitrospinaceae bacterium]NIR55248.1 hypothetical protein [Nitrospinaceae bacterium]NIS85686.1 hypothetical protein [Nitrospinaceae bacterium]NIT82537.1 hypothetical protein [Nitrospinaceae bacterium]NIU44741.1 hypothetical protein [Nitrospinaceae bacterium]